MSNLKLLKFIYIVTQTVLLSTLYIVYINPDLYMLAAWNMLLGIIIFYSYLIYYYFSSLKVKRNHPFRSMSCIWMVLPLVALWKNAEKKTVKSIAKLSPDELAELAGRIVINKMPTRSLEHAAALMQNDLNSKLMIATRVKREFTDVSSNFSTIAVKKPFSIFTENGVTGKKTQFIETWIKDTSYEVSKVLIKESGNTSLSLLDASLIERFPFSVSFTVLVLLSTAVQLSKIKCSSPILHVYGEMFRLYNNKGLTGEKFYQVLFEQPGIYTPLNELRKVDPVSYDYITYNLHTYLPFVEGTTMILYS